MCVSVRCVWECDVCVCEFERERNKLLWVKKEADWFWCWSTNVRLEWTVEETFTKETIFVGKLRNAATININNNDKQQQQQRQQQHQQRSNNKHQQQQQQTTTATATTAMTYWLVHVEKLFLWVQTAFFDLMWTYMVFFFQENTRYFKCRQFV